MTRKIVKRTAPSLTMEMERLEPQLKKTRTPAREGSPSAIRVGSKAQLPCPWLFCIIRRQVVWRPFRVHIPARRFDSAPATNPPGEYPIKTKYSTNQSALIMQGNGRLILNNWPGAYPINIETGKKPRHSRNSQRLGHERPYASCGGYCRHGGI